MSQALRLIRQMLADAEVVAPRAACVSVDRAALKEVLSLAAQGIEARRVETGTGSIGDESSVAEGGDAQPSSSESH